MTPRLDYRAASPKAVAALAGLEAYIRDCGLERPLLTLVMTRASQINGCAFCIDMHAKDARMAGETEQRLFGLSAWRATPFFTDRERAALAWTEAVTRVADGPIDDALYKDVREQFSEKELVDLAVAVIAINGWNRLAVPFQKVPGPNQPTRK